MAVGPTAVEAVRSRSHCFLELHRVAQSPASSAPWPPLSSEILRSHYSAVHADAALDNLAPAPIVRRSNSKPTSEAGAGAAGDASKSPEVATARPAAASRAGVTSGLRVSTPATSGGAVRAAAGSLLDRAAAAPDAGPLRRSERSSLSVGSPRRSATEGQGLRGAPRERSIAAPPLDLGDPGLSAAVARLHSEHEATSWIVLGYGPGRRRGAGPGGDSTAEEEEQEEEEGDDEGGPDEARPAVGAPPACVPRSGRLVVLAEGASALDAMAAPASAGTASSVLAGLRRAGWGPAYLYLRLTEADISPTHAAAPAEERRSRKATFVLAPHAPRGTGPAGWERFSASSQALLRARLTLASHRTAVSSFLAHHVTVAAHGMGWPAEGPADWPLHHPGRMASQGPAWEGEGAAAIPARDIVAAVRKLHPPDRITLAVEMSGAGSLPPGGVQLRVRLPLGASVGDLRAILARRYPDAAPGLVLFRQLPLSAARDDAAKGTAAQGATAAAAAAVAARGLGAATAARGAGPSGGLRSLMGLLQDDAAPLRRALQDGETVFAVATAGGEAGAAAAAGSEEPSSSSSLSSPLSSSSSSRGQPLDANAVLSRAREAHAQRVKRVVGRGAVSTPRDRDAILANVLARTGSFLGRPARAVRRPGEHGGRVPSHSVSGGGAGQGSAEPSWSRGELRPPALPAGRARGARPPGRPGPPRTPPCSPGGTRARSASPARRAGAIGRPPRPRFRVAPGGGLDPAQRKPRGLAAGLRAAAERRASRAADRPSPPSSPRRGGPRVGRVVASAEVAGSSPPPPGAPADNAAWMRALDGGAELALPAREELQLRMAFREIPLGQLELGRVLGRGVTAVVRQAKWWQPAEAGASPPRGAAPGSASASDDVEERAMTEVAVKEFTAARAGLRPEAQVKAFMRELGALREVPASPNVVQVLGACTHPQLRLVLEYMPFGDLYSALRSRAPPRYGAGGGAGGGAGAAGDEPDPLGLPTRVRLGLDVARGVAHLHACGRVHRDLKSHNVLLDVDGGELRAKVGDFGTARLMDEAREAPWTQTGTQGYVAPEVLGGVDGADGRSREVDVFSLGVVLWELVAEDPVGGNTLSALPPVRYCAALQSGRRPPFPEEVPAGYTALALRCWEFDPSMRPPIEEAVRLLEEVLEGL